MKVILLHRTVGLVLVMVLVLVLLLLLLRNWRFLSTKLLLLLRLLMTFDKVI
jgi:hypothetical protein